jgi:multisubunit Na+/H+ antiporter MnhB subunit
MDMLTAVFAQLGSLAGNPPRPSEDDYYREHEARRTTGFRLILPLIVGFGVCLAAVGLLNT